MTALQKWRAAQAQCTRSLKVFSRDVGAGLLDVGHNSLALVGLCVVGVAVFVGSRDDMRHQVEQHAFDWLRLRAEAREPAVQPVLPAEPTAVERATAADPKSLTRQQAAVANWISRRYRVAPEPISRLVQEAWLVGQRTGLEPTLILAIMAVESSFNPFAQSSVGAQGLMQVMTRVHDDKYDSFGGVHAAFDPVSNLRVGVLVLRECIQRAGGLEQGLKYYVGAANLVDDGGYAAKVLTEQGFMKRVAQGVAVAFNVTVTAPTVASAGGAVNNSANSSNGAANPAAASTRKVSVPEPAAPSGSAPAPEAAPKSDDERVALI